VNKELFKNINEYYLVGVSGGPDSMALLDILYCMGLKLIVCNVNYKTRVESDYEENLVRDYCFKRGILFFSKVCDYYSKGNFEEFARVERYKFFKGIYEEYDCKGLVIAHHLYDSLETYLLQKRRRSVVKHYGLDNVSIVMGMKVIRPLLDSFKEDLIAYCDSHNILYSIDKSNLENKYERNKIRNIELSNMTKDDILTLVNKMNKENERNDLFFKSLNNKFYEIVNNDFIDLDKFSILSEDDKVFILYMYLEKFLNDYLKKLSKNRLKDLILKIESSEGSKTFNINDEYDLVKEYSKLRVLYKKKVYEYSYVINKDDVMENEIFKVSKEGIYKCEIGAYDSDFPLVIRNYKEGDMIKLKVGTKKVSRIFIDKKVPSEIRAMYPVVVNKDNEVIFVPKFYKDLERKSLQSGLFMVQLIY
jgi:tRNA(Ile)-lysidine synthase